ncbi:MAG: hypothetical protein IJC99_01845 [Clostridia bacterium]|nr:hypothetical protein [Clostridia bacterium]
MHFFKWLGVFLLFLTGALTGISLLTFERRRVTQAEGFLSLLRFFRWQIDALAEPIPQILADCDATVLSACGWQESARPATLDALLGGVTLYLSEDICRLLYDFAGSLGTVYREEQLRGCDYHLARLSPYCEKLRQELPKRERMALFLPIAAALCLILLLL